VNIVSEQASQLLTVFLLMCHSFF